jgi:hypothetical protein
MNAYLQGQISILNKKIDKWDIFHMVHNYKIYFYHPIWAIIDMHRVMLQQKPTMHQKPVTTKQSIHDTRAIEGNDFLECDLSFDQ